MTAYPEKTRVGSAYGAPMGRHTAGAAGPLYGRVRARRVRLDRGGYDSGGAYWGIGTPLFYVYDVDGADMFLRASSNADAIAKAKEARGWDPATS